MTGRNPKTGKSVTFGAVARRGGGWLPLLGVTGLIGTLSTLALPLALGRAVDAIVATATATATATGGSASASAAGGDPAGASAGASAAGWWLALTLGLVVLGIAADLVEVFAETACIAGTTAWLRTRLVRHTLAIGPRATRRLDTGDLVSRVSGNAVDAAQAGPGAIAVATAALPPVGSLVLLAYIDVRVAAAFLAGVALVALVLRAFTRRTAEVLTSYQQAQGAIAARLAESLSGARTIAAAGTVEREEGRVLEPLPKLRQHGMRTWHVLARSGAQAAIVGPLVLVAVLTVGGLGLVDGRITAGELFAASRYAVIGAGLGSLTGVFGRLARGRAGVRRAAEVLRVAPVGYGRRALPPGPGRLELRAVTVREQDRSLLDGVDLSLPGGAAVAVVGRSGAGKSVLAEVAARLRDPDSGQVCLDGVPLPELSHDALRGAVGCAFERPVLVGGTVADAIGMGSDPDTVRAAARATHAHEFVSRLPRGYDTPLAEAPMSGGELQRLGLARAWHADRLLVLDDATSSLDMVTEMQISRTLLNGANGARRRRTRLIVTHRAATAAAADLVVWLDAGRVRCVGPHARLWREPGYREVFG